MQVAVSKLLIGNHCGGEQRRVGRRRQPASGGQQRQQPTASTSSWVGAHFGPVSAAAFGIPAEAEISIVIDEQAREARQIHVLT